jgi:hypothetical protein
MRRGALSRGPRDSRSLEMIKSGLDASAAATLTSILNAVQIQILNVVRGCGPR